MARAESLAKSRRSMFMPDTLCGHVKDVERQVAEKYSYVGKAFSDTRIAEVSTRAQSNRNFVGK